MSLQDVSRTEETKDLLSQRTSKTNQQAPIPQKKTPIHNFRPFSNDIKSETKAKVNINLNGKLQKKSDLKKKEIQTELLEEEDSTGYSEAFLTPSEDFSRSRSNSFCQSLNDLAKNSQFGGFDCYSIQKSYAEMHKGEFIEPKGTSCLFKCRMRHFFELSEFERKANAWCRTCRLIFDSIQSYAKELGGAVTSDFLEENVNFRCKEGHVWNAHYKKAQQKWCPECKKASAERLKARLAKEAQEQETEDRQNQNRLFAEAKKRMLQERDLQRKECPPSSEQIEASIETMASKYAKEYSQSVKQKELSVPDGQLMTLYKLLLYPERLLLAKFQSCEGEDAKKRLYRQLAVQVHPDKNRHPTAASAFKKLHHVFTSAVQN